MKRFTQTVLALALITIVSSAAFAGNIAGGRMTGNIPVGRAAGNIPIGRSAVVETPIINLGATSQTSSRFNLESEISGNFAGLIQMLLNAGALL